MLQSLERLLGPWSASITAVCLLWGGAGLLVGLLSNIVVPHRPTDRQVSALMAGKLAGLIVVLCIAGQVRGQGQAPADAEIAQAISRGVEFLKSAQADNGEWQYQQQPHHSLGMTALAGLALLENGMSREAHEISKAPEHVTTLAHGRTRRTTWRWRSCFWRVASKLRRWWRRADSIARAAAGATAIMTASGITRCRWVGTSRQMIRPGAPQRTAEAGTQPPAVWR